MTGNLQSALEAVKKSGLKCAFDKASLFTASIDNSRYSSMPDAVVYARNEKEVSLVLKIAEEFDVFITPRGAGSGCSGAALPLSGGIVLDLSNLNFIEIDPLSRVAHVGAGAITAQVDFHAGKFGLFYAPDPSSHEYSTIGGNIAHNAGGLRAAKYGNTRDNLLALTAVLVGGRVIRCGLPLRKFSAGLNLRDMFVGSEGTLGVITQAWLKLLPKPESKKVVLALFNGDSQAFKGIDKILLSHLQPSILEFMDADTVECVRRKRKCSVDIPRGSAVLLAEFDGSKDSVVSSSNEFLKILMRDAVVRIPEDEEENLLWSLRRSASPAMYELGDSKVGTDIVLPFGKVASYFAFLKKLAKDINLPALVFGHAADGNYHIHFMYNDSDNSRARALNAMRTAVEKTVEMGGAISGEHGIGFLKAQYMDIQHGESEMDTMRAVKQALDPKGILNPNKLYYYHKNNLRPLRGVKLPWD